MITSRRFVVLLVIGFLVVVAAFIGSRATARPELALSIAAQPSSGAVGSTVTITGQGAAPNAYITINGGYRQATAGCPAAAGGGAVRSAIFAHTTADGAGNFSATFQVLPDGGEYGQAYFTAFSPATANGLSPMVCFDIVGQAGLFAETSKTVHGSFLAHWEANGGLAQFGHPNLGYLVSFSVL